MRAITRRLWTTVAIALAFVAEWGATRAAAVEPDWAEGEWIGGFEGVDGTVYMTAQLDAADDGELTGSLELPLQSDGAVKLDQRQGDRRRSLRFDVRGAEDAPRVRRQAQGGRDASPGRCGRAAAPPASSC